MSTGAVLSPQFFLQTTRRFSALSLLRTERETERETERDVANLLLQGFTAPHRVPQTVFLKWDCEYTEQIIGDFEHLEWEPVLQARQGASSFLVRKGLSRKAQLALQMRRFVAKHPTSVLRRAVPETHIIETWSAFDDMKLDLGGGVMASFDMPDLQQASLRQRLDWALTEVRALFIPDVDTATGEVIHLTEHTKNTNENGGTDTLWILKPSVTNKGADISIVREWDDLLDCLENTPDMREWVLQRYLPNPLLVNGGHKFHLRVYVLCIGALRVFVFEDILMLIAAHKYDADDIEDIYRHLTNTARAAEDINFDERLFVQLLRDLPGIIHKENPNQYPTMEAAQAGVSNIREQIKEIVGDLFRAYENEYSIFCPMTNCFELYGLDFLVDEDLNVHFLEVNPGPDFKQTGGRLRSVIIQLWEQVFRIAIDGSLLLDQALAHDQYDMRYESYWKTMAPDFALVYSKEWSVSHLKGGMTLK